MFLGLQVDRNNLSQAVSGTFLKDLGLNTNGTTPHHSPDEDLSITNSGHI